MRDLGKLIVSTGLEKLPKVQKIAQSGHIDNYWPNFRLLGRLSKESKTGILKAANDQKTLKEYELGSSGAI